MVVGGQLFENSFGEAGLVFSEALKLGNARATRIWSEAALEIERFKERFAHGAGDELSCFRVFVGVCVNDLGTPFTCDGGQKEDKRRTKRGQNEDKRRTKGGQKED